MLQDAGPKTVGVFFSFRFVLRTPHAVLCRPLPSDSVGPLYNEGLLREPGAGFRF